MLAPALEPEVLNKEPELAAIVAAPGGAPSGPISSMRSDKAAIVTAPGGASKLVPSSTRSDKMAEPEALNRDPAPSWPLPVVLAMARIGAKYLAMSRWALATHAARQAKLGNPSFVSKAAAASSLSQICLDCIWDRQCRNMGQPLPLPLSVRHGDARGAAREGSAGTCRPARPRPRGPATTRRQADWQGCRAATCPCLWWGAAGAVGWRWPADGWQPAASWCPSLPAGGAGCLGDEADLVSWRVLSGTPPDGDRPSLDGAVPFVAASQRRTSRTPRQARLTETTECWARRRRHGAGGGTEGD